MDIISVTGKDMNKWVTFQHFVSYLRLAPRPRTSGGKKPGHENHKTTSPATLAFRQAAHSLANSKGSLEKFYRNSCIKKGKKAAKKAVARELAVLFYTLVKNRTPCDRTFLAEQENKMKKKKIAKLGRKAEKFGYSLEIKSA